MWNNRAFYKIIQKLYILYFILVVASFLCIKNYFHQNFPSLPFSILNESQSNSDILIRSKTYSPMNYDSLKNPYFCYSPQFNFDQTDYFCSMCKLKVDILPNCIKNETIQYNSNDFPALKPHLYFFSSGIYSSNQMRKSYFEKELNHPVYYWHLKNSIFRNDYAILNDTSVYLPSSKMKSPLNYFQNYSRHYSVKKIDTLIVYQMYTNETQYNYRFLLWYFLDFAFAVYSGKTNASIYLPNVPDALINILNSQKKDLFNFTFINIYDDEILFVKDIHLYSGPFFNLKILTFFRKKIVIEYGLDKEPPNLILFASPFSLPSESILSQIKRTSLFEIEFLIIKNRNIKNTITKFNRAKMVIGYHHPSLSYVMFMQKKSTLCEISCIKDQNTLYLLTQAFGVNLIVARDYSKTFNSQLIIDVLKYYQKHIKTDI